MKTYSTVLGDTWDIIAFKVYGQEKYAKQLVEANPEYVHIVVFSGGCILKIPELEVSEDTSLPPWKRGV